MNTTSTIITAKADAFLFRDPDTYARDTNGKPLIRVPGYVSDAERAALDAKQIRETDLTRIVIAAFGVPRNYFETTVRIAGFDFTYRAACDGPDKISKADFDAYVSRLSGRLMAFAYKSDDASSRDSSPFV